MLAVTLLAALYTSAQAALTPRAPAYSVKVGELGSWTHPDDTSANSYIDKDGTYYFQQAHALYGPNDTRSWSFFSGTNMDDAKRHAISQAVNPHNMLDSNKDTTWRCNNSPTGKKSTYAPQKGRYAQANYCDLAALWVDPDTGDWVGLVHNEFTPQPFSDGLHFDAIDVAVSRDQGRTWSITDQVLTSPYSTDRGDNATFPAQTYYYGDGDPRLLVDVASGFFYVWYGSRVVDKGGSWAAFHAHVARAPIKDKMAPGSWQKYYDGGWGQPGLGGKESNLVPSGYTPVGREYSPSTPGKAKDQVANGLCPPSSPLFVMDVSYSAYLGVWLGEPQNVDQSGNASQEIYYTTDLATQKWTLLGDTGSYRTASWYRWFLDPASATSSAVLGREFRAYCSFGCSGGRSSEYVNLAIEGPAYAPVDASKTYTISAGGLFLAESNGSLSASPQGVKWTFKPTGNGAYTLSSGSGNLGVASDTPTTRAWGTVPSLSNASAVGQQWWVIPSQANTFRLVNRYSGLVLALSSRPGREVETTPGRSWDHVGQGVGGGRRASEQELVLSAE